VLANEAILADTAVLYFIAKFCQKCPATIPEGGEEEEPPPPLEVSLIFSSGNRPSA